MVSDSVLLPMGQILYSGISYYKFIPCIDNVLLLKIYLKANLPVKRSQFMMNWQMYGTNSAYFVSGRGNFLDDDTSVP